MLSPLLKMAEDLHCMISVVCLFPFVCFFLKLLYFCIMVRLIHNTLKKYRDFKS